jgi:hypothetical protein
MPEARSCGCGRELMAAGLLAGKAKDVHLQVAGSEDNKVAVALYSSLGFAWDPSAPKKTEMLLDAHRVHDAIEAARARRGRPSAGDAAAPAAAAAAPAAAVASVPAAALVASPVPSAVAHRLAAAVELRVCADGRVAAAVEVRVRPRPAETTAPMPRPASAPSVVAHKEKPASEEEPASVISLRCCDQRAG